jgi:hypothetical protein
MTAVYKSIFANRQSDSLLDRLLVRLDQSEDSAQWKEHRAAALGLNNPSSAARKLRVSPGRVTSLIKSGSVRLYPVNNQYRYVKVKEAHSRSMKGTSISPAPCAVAMRKDHHASRLGGCAPAHADAAACTSRNTPNSSTDAPAPAGWRGSTPHTSEPGKRQQHHRHRREMPAAQRQQGREHRGRAAARSCHWPRPAATPSRG